LTVIFFSLGLYYPILSAKYSILDFGLNYKEIRLFDSVRIFYKEGSFLLAGIILVFTIILPVIKYIEIANRLFQRIRIPANFSKFLHSIDKWSMLDVFLVALLLLNFKMNSSFISMHLQVGTNYIALAVLSRMLLSILVDRYNLRKANLK
ncbi:MAG: paraquat-inducible protein A, partial [Chlorobi bacterium]|nr:paraquat-inducible protein A [Chlorobiota bacterium]